ncbi:MAG: TolC family protein, partial [Pseudomonadota bacterium]
MSRWKIGCAAVALWVGTGGFASAETLREALRTAYVNNPQIEAQRKSAQIAQEQLAQARAQRRPQVNLSGSVGYESVESNRPFSLNVGERPLASAQLEAVVPVYVGGRIKSGIEQAKAGIGVANAQLEGVSQDLILQVVTSYVDVLRDRQTIA